MTTLSCIDADGRRFDVVAEHLCAGFMEQGEYHFLCIAGAGLYIDDLPLAIGVRDGESFWLWSPGYFAGEVCAELLNSQESYLPVIGWMCRRVPKSWGASLSSGCLSRSLNSTLRYCLAPKAPSSA